MNNAAPTNNRTKYPNTYFCAECKEVIFDSCPHRPAIGPDVVTTVSGNPGYPSTSPTGAAPLPPISIDEFTGYDDRDDPPTMNIVDATIAERGKVYGDPELSHINIGLAWTGAIQQHYGIRLDHPIPGWLVSMMMVQFKTNRSARVYKEDNFTDLLAYTKFAEQDQKKAEGK